MSKSLGNVISPLEVAKRRGAEILRMWVSMVDFLEDMRLSDEILDRNSEAYRKIRNTMRYLLGNLYGFDPEKDAVPYAAMPEIDRWALHQLEALRKRIVSAYGGHQYHVVYHSLHQFCAVTLSSFYLDILKDRLYTAPRRSLRRRSGQTVLNRLAMDLTRLMAPILCFTADEVWQELLALRGEEKWKTSTVHAQLFPEPLEVEEAPELIERWDRLTSIREEVAKALEAARASKRIGSSLEAKVVIEAPDEVETFLRSFGDDLHFLFITSEVEFGPARSSSPEDSTILVSDRVPGLGVAVLRARGTKCQRCWNYTDDVGEDGTWPGICGRCAAALKEADADGATG
jgi:isoleucyl-tRNA synthetase